MIVRSWTGGAAGAAGAAIVFILGFLGGLGLWGARTLTARLTSKPRARSLDMTPMIAFLVFPSFSPASVPLKPAFHRARIATSSLFISIRLVIYDFLVFHAAERAVCRNDERHLFAYAADDFFGREQRRDDDQMTVGDVESLGQLGVIFGNHRIHFVGAITGHGALHVARGFGLKSIEASTVALWRALTR
jgi:hypothetical protein